MAWKPKNANIDIRQSARVFDEQAFVDGVISHVNLSMRGKGIEYRKKAMAIYSKVLGSEYSQVLSLQKIIVMLVQGSKRSFTFK